MTADDVPIAVPRSCKKYMSPHSNMLFRMIICMAWMIASIGKLAGRVSFSLGL